MTDDAERREWVDEWRRSKLNAKEFCRKHGLSIASLYRWSRGAPGTSQGIGVAPVTRFIEAVPVTMDQGKREWAWEFEGPGGVVRGRALDRAGLAELLEAATRRAR